jgi:hypothetical protein
MAFHVVLLISLKKLLMNLSNHGVSCCALGIFKKLLMNLSNHGVSCCALGIFEKLLMSRGAMIWFENV